MSLYSAENKICHKNIALCTSTPRLSRPGGRGGDDVKGMFLFEIADSVYGFKKYASPYPDILEFFRLVRSVSCCSEWPAR